MQQSPRGSPVDNPNTYHPTGGDWTYRRFTVLFQVVWQQYAGSLDLTFAENDFNPSDNTELNRFASNARRPGRSAMLEAQRFVRENVRRDLRGNVVSIAIDSIAAAPVTGCRRATPPHYEGCAEAQTRGRHGLGWGGSCSRIGASGGIASSTGTLLSSASEGR